MQPRTASQLRGDHPPSNHVINQRRPRRRGHGRSRATSSHLTTTDSATSATWTPKSPSRARPPLHDTTRRQARRQAASHEADAASDAAERRAIPMQPRTASQLRGDHPPSNHVINQRRPRRRGHGRSRATSSHLTTTDSATSATWTRTPSTPTYGALCRTRNSP